MQVSRVGRYFTWAPDWLVALVLVRATIAVALVLHAILDRVILKLSGARHPVLGTLIRRTRGVTRYGLILYLLSVIIPILPLDRAATDLANKVFVAALILLIGWVVLLSA